MDVVTSEAHAERSRLVPKDLLQPGRLFVPSVLRQLLIIAREHLDQGWLYTMAIPRRKSAPPVLHVPILFGGGNAAADRPFG